MRALPVPDIVPPCPSAESAQTMWTPAATPTTAEDGATFATDIVGVDAARASDRTLFRVLEWGRMGVGCLVHWSG
jgi:hypothetical protein